MPRKGGSGANEIFGKRPRLWPAVEEILAFALKDEEAPEGTPPPGLPELLARRDAALRFAAQAEGDQIPDLQFHQVFHEFGIDLGQWLTDLPHDLASAKLADEALDLMKRLAIVIPEFDADQDAAELLAIAGRREETLAEVEKMIRESPEAWTLVRAADALKVIGEKTRALALYRKSEILSDEFEDRQTIIEREISLLEELGRAEEANVLREALQHLAETTPYDEESFEDDEGIAEPEEEFIPEPAKAQPEPARNAPCPCGSGKKYKRCCGKSG